MKVFAQLYTKYVHCTSTQRTLTGLWYYILVFLSTIVQHLWFAGLGYAATPSLNDDFGRKNEPNEIHLLACLYVPKGQIFLLSYKWLFFVEIRGFSAGNPPKGEKNLSLLSEIFPTGYVFFTYFADLYWLGMCLNHSILVYVHMSSLGFIFFAEVIIQTRSELVWVPSMMILLLFVTLLKIKEK